MKTTVIIYADDDLERLTDLRRNVAIAEQNAVDAKATATRHGDTTEDEDAAVEAAKAAYDAFVDEAAERADAWVLSNIGHGEFRDLVGKHPVRKVDAEPEQLADNTVAVGKQVTHPDDEPFGVNMETFGKALLLFVDPDDDEVRTILEPTENVARKVKRLSAGQFDTLWVAAYYLNVGGIGDPKAMRFSIAPTSSAT